MLVRILCTGPSLTETWRRYGVGGIGPIIAVNRAVDFTAADWMVAGDAVTFTRTRCRPLRGLVSFNASLRDDLPQRLRGLECLAWEDLPPCPWPPQWGLEAAILLAVRLADRQPLQVVLFGVDWSGTLDWDGTPPADDRSPDRWSRERPAIERLIDHLHRTTPTRVTRITP